MNEATRLTQAHVQLQKFIVFFAIFSFYLYFAVERLHIVMTYFIFLLKNFVFVFNNFRLPYRGTCYIFMDIFLLWLMMPRYVIRLQFKKIKMIMCSVGWLLQLSSGNWYCCMKSNYNFLISSKWWKEEEINIIFIWLCGEGCGLSSVVYA